MLPGYVIVGAAVDMSGIGQSGTGPKVLWCGLGLATAGAGIGCDFAQVGEFLGVPGSPSGVVSHNSKVFWGKLAVCSLEDVRVDLMEIAEGRPVASSRFGTRPDALVRYEGAYVLVWRMHDG